MILPDHNLLLYAHDVTAPNHRLAAAWWEGCINGAEPVGLPRVVLFGFMRLATSARVYASPMTVEEAAQCIESWTARPHVVELDGGPRHVAEVVDLLSESGSKCSGTRTVVPSRSTTSYLSPFVDDPSRSTALTSVNIDVDGDGSRSLPFDTRRGGRPR